MKSLEYNNISDICPMRKLLLYTKLFIAEDWNRRVYVITFLFLIAAITLNYTIGLENKILNSYHKQPIGILYYFLLYAGAYFLILAPKLWLSKEFAIMRNYRMWLKSGFFIALLAIAVGYYFFYIWAERYQDYEEYFIAKIAANMRFVTIFIVPLLLLWLIADKKNTPFIYGFTLKNFDYKPYLFLLCCMIPLVVAASFMPEFLKTYPKFKPWFIKGEVFGLSTFEMTSMYEFSYGLNFVCIELFFRGALVIGMVSLLGRHAVLPMAVVYCFIHFGKPLPECISSFFGGYLLGIIALYTRSIFGGVIIHLGIAWLMETVAYFQHYVKN